MNTKKKNVTVATIMLVQLYFNVAQTSEPGEKFLNHEEKYLSKKEVDKGIYNAILCEIRNESLQMQQFLSEKKPAYIVTEKSDKSELEAPWIVWGTISDRAVQVLQFEKIATTLDLDTDDKNLLQQKIALMKELVFEEIMRIFNYAYTQSVALLEKRTMKIQQWLKQKDITPYLMGGRIGLGSAQERYDVNKKDFDIIHSHLGYMLFELEKIFDFQWVKQYIERVGIAKMSSLQARVKNLFDHLLRITDRYLSFIEKTIDSNNDPLIKDAAKKFLSDIALKYYKYLDGMERTFRKIFPDFNKEAFKKQKPIGEKTQASIEKNAQELIQEKVIEIAEKLNSGIELRKD